MEISRGKIRINYDILAVQLLWLAIFIVEPINYIIKLLIKLLVVWFDMIYIFCSYEKIDIKYNFWICIYVLIGFYSSYCNFCNSKVNLLSSIVSLLLIMEVFLVFQIAGTKKEFIEIIKASFGALILLWLPTTISVFLSGHNDFGGNSHYFIGNKFNVLYYYIFILCLMGILYRKHSCEKVKFKYIFWITYIFSIFMSIYIVCVTASLMLIFVLICILLFELRRKSIRKKHIITIYNLLSSKIFFINCIVFSGLILLFIDELVSNEFVSNILDLLNKSDTMNSRLKIYTYLNEIITEKLWFGYGYNSVIVANTIGGNAQNGVMHIIVQFGIMGIVCFLLVCWSSFFNKAKISKFESRWIMYWIYAFVIASVIEIVYGQYFIILLSLYKLSNMRKM